MIKRFVKKVQTLFSRGLKPARPRKEPKRIEAGEHQINRELVSRSALRVCETLQKAGFRAYLVGGAVRDLLLNRPSHDLDFTLAGDPRPLARKVAAELFILRDDDCRELSHGAYRPPGRPRRLPLAAVINADACRQTCSVRCATEPTGSPWETPRRARDPTRARPSRQK